MRVSGIWAKIWSLGYFLPKRGKFLHFLADFCLLLVSSLWFACVRNFEIQFLITHFSYIYHSVLVENRTNTSNSLRADGNILSLNDWLIIWASGLARDAEKIFKTLVGMLVCPLAFEEFWFLSSMASFFWNRFKK